MARDNGLRHRFEFRRVLREIRPRAAPSFRGVARQFHAVDGEHLVPDQSLPIADRDDRGEGPRDRIPQSTHEVGNRGEVRRVIAAQRDKGHVLLAEAFDAAAADHAVRIRDEHHLEQEAWWVGRRAGRIVMKACVEQREIELVVDEVCHGMFERARQQLAREIDRQQLGLGIDVLIAGHVDQRLREPAELHSLITLVAA